LHAITLTSNSHLLLNFFTWKIKIINFKNFDFCKLKVVFSESVIRFSNLQISKKIFQKLPITVKYFWREI
jgi:hypothetical protein